MITGPLAPPALLLAAVLCLAPGRAGAWSLPDMMAAMAEVQAEQAYFDQEKWVSVLQEPIRTSGLLAYRAPSYMRMETLTPFLEILEVEGEWLRIDGEETRQRFHLPSYPLLQALVEAMRSTMAGDLARLQQFYAVTFTGDEPAWVLDLEPLHADFREQLRRTTIEGSENLITRVTTLEADGDRSVMMVRVIEVR